MLSIRYFSLNCVDEHEGFSVFHAFQPNTPNLVSAELIVKDALNNGIIDKNQAEQINDVVSITKEDYDRAMNA